MLALLPTACSTGREIATAGLGVLALAGLVALWVHHLDRTGGHEGWKGRRLHLQRVWNWGLVATMAGMGVVLLIAGGVVAVVRAGNPCF